MFQNDRKCYERANKGLIGKYYETSAVFVFAPLCDAGLALTGCFHLVCILHNNQEEQGGECSHSQGLESTGPVGRRAKTDDATLHLVFKLKRFLKNCKKIRNGCTELKFFHVKIQPSPKREKKFSFLRPFLIFFTIFQKLELKFFHV